MHGKIKNILKKTALLLTLGLTCITAVSIGKPQNVQAASHIYKNKTFYVYAEHAVTIQSWFSDDKINGSKEFNWNDRGLGSINVYSEGNGYTYNGKNCYCPCTIVAMIEALHDVHDGDDFDEITEDQREIVDDITIEYCTADIYSIDGDLLNVILTFETPQDEYLKDLMEMLDTYRQMAEKHIDNKNITIPMFSLSFIPEKYDGEVGATFSFPLSYFRTLDGNDQETQAHLIFNMENASYQQFDIDEDTMAEIEADVLRDIDQKRAVNEAAEEDERPMFQ